MLKKGDKKYNSKLRKIEKYIKGHGSIDKETAVAKFDEYYLPQVISALKQQGNDIRFVNGRYMYAYKYEPKLTTEMWEQIKNDYYIQEDEIPKFDPNATYTPIIEPKEYYVVVAIHNHGNNITYEISDRLFESSHEATDYASFGKRLDDSIIEYVIKKVSVM